MNGIKIQQDNLKKLESQVEKFGQFVNFAVKELTVNFENTNRAIYSLMKENNLIRINNEQDKVDAFNRNVVRIFNENKTKLTNMRKQIVVKLDSIIAIEMNKEKEAIKALQVLPPVNKIRQGEELRKRVEVKIIIPEEGEIVDDTQPIQISPPINIEEGEIVDDTQPIQISPPINIEEFCYENINEIKIFDGNSDFIPEIKVEAYVENIDLLNDKVILSKIENFIPKNKRVIIDDIDDDDDIEDDGIQYQLQLLQKKKKNSIFHVVKSDTQGTMINSNRPKDKIFKSHREVLCAFCGYSNKNKEVEDKLGPFYGPFLNEKGIIYYIHEYCAMYSPNIHLDKDGRLTNVCEDIKQSCKLLCHLCKKSGASIPCHFKTCRKHYHFLCARKEECMFDNQSFIMHCEEHVREDMYYHDDLNSDIVCTVCKSGLDEDVLILCSQCEASYHIYCLTPKLNRVPEGDWFCSKCAKIKSLKN